MKRPRKRQQRATSHVRVQRFAANAALGAALSLAIGCSSGVITEEGVPGSNGGSATSGDSGAGPGGAKANAGQSSVGQGGTGQGPTSQGGSGAAAGAPPAGKGGSTGQVEDPYAIPATAPSAVLVPTPRIARLSRTQWSNAVRDLLKLTDISEVDRTVSGDALIGFDNEADSLYVTEQLRQQLATAAEQLADQVTTNASALARLMPANAPTSGSARARAFITSFGQRAFRRTLTDSEVTTHLSLFDQGPTLYPDVDAFAAGASLVIQAMLQSPFFLYRTELGTVAAGASSIPLNDWEVASKLSFAITNTMPDDTLLTAAAAGQLKEKSAVLTQAKRLLESANGTAGLRNFNLQVYRLGTYDGIQRDAKTFPDFKPNTPLAMKAEVLQFIDWVFTQGRGVKDFYTAPVGFVNSLLAPLYGVSGNFSSEPTTLTKVDLEPSKRAGLLTQAGFLSSYISVGDEPDIIHRGVFIATRLLCKTLPPPDPAAAGKGLVDTPNLTNRERVEATTGKGTCGAICHGALFNPLGYAFENYDAVGKYRSMYQVKPVDAADSYTLDGQLKSFKNGVELSALLAEAKETHSCYVQNMLSYLQGQELSAEQQALVDYYARLSRAGMVSLRDLELQIVTSDAFLNRRP